MHSQGHESSVIIYVEQVEQWLSSVDVGVGVIYRGGTRIAALWGEVGGTRIVVARGILLPLWGDQ